MSPSTGTAALASAVAAACLAPMALIGVAVTAASGVPVALAETGCGPGGGAGGGAVVAAEGEYSAEQMTIARTIVNTTAHRRLPRRATVLAVATALVESGLRNLDHGDRDSLGVFQQRPSQGWGARAQLLDPVYATNAFLDRLVSIPSWQRLPDGVAEQLVQRSGFPGRYAPQHRAASAIVAKFWRAPERDAARGGVARVSIISACPDHEASDIPLEKTKLPADYTLPLDPVQRAAVSYALSKLGRPYVWGAKGPDAFDCSGLMMAAWAHAGVAIGAATTTQVHDGRPIPSMAAIAPGDLVFIPGSLGTRTNPRHVGMYAGHGLIVNAYDSSTGVVLERLDAWRDQIVSIRRVHEPTRHGSDRA